MREKTRNVSRHRGSVADLFCGSNRNRRISGGCANSAGVEYYDNDLVVCKPDGSPYLQKRISARFTGFMRSTGMPKIRFHDLRGTAGTNMYNLTGDFYAVSQILGHSVDDFAQQMGVNLNINTVTTRYVQVQEQRKLNVLTAYHRAVFATPQNGAAGNNSL